RRAELRRQPDRRAQRSPDRLRGPIYRERGELSARRASRRYDLSVRVVPPRPRARGCMPLAGRADAGRQQLQSDPDARDNRTLDGVTRTGYGRRMQFTDPEAQAVFERYDNRHREERELTSSLPPGAFGERRDEFLLPVGAAVGNFLRA